MEEKEGGATEGEAGDELEDEPPAAGRVGRGRVGRERAAGLERRGEGSVVQNWNEECAVVLSGERGRSPGEEHGAEEDVDEFLIVVRLGKSGVM